MKLEVDTLRTGLLVLASSPNDVPPEQLPELVADLARAQAALLSAASRPSTVHRQPEHPEPDCMLDAREAAEMLGVTKRWLYRHASTLAFSRKLSRKVLRFSRTGIAKWLATKRL